MSALAIPMEVPATREAVRKTRTSRPHLQLVTEDYSAASVQGTPAVLPRELVRRPQPRAVASHAVADRSARRLAASRRADAQMAQPRAVSKAEAAAANKAEGLPVAIKNAFWAAGFVVALSVVVSFAMVLGALFATPASTSTVVVQSGDSLWSVAQATGNEDISETVAQIAELNNLDSATLQAGQELLVPTN